MSTRTLSTKSIYILPFTILCQNQIGAEESTYSSGQRNSWCHCSDSRDKGSAEISETERDREATCAEWVVEDQPGVFITLRSLPDGSQELVRVELM